MKLRITTPLEVVVDEDGVQALRAEDSSGGFGILAGHADFLTSLAISVVRWKTKDETRRYCAVRRGVLSVDGGQDISIATRDAVLGDDLATLAETVLARFRADIETERCRARQQHPPGIERDPPNRQPPPGRRRGNWRFPMTEPGRAQPDEDPLLKEVRSRARRELDWVKFGEPSVARRLSQIGVLGWIIVTPMLVGVFAGRWIDAKFGTGIFWTAPFLMLGAALGCWSAWKWMRSE